MMPRSIVRIFSVIAVLLVTVPVYPSEHEELKATPGLWKITYRSRIAGQPDPAIVKWQCVSEEQMEDPGTAFGEPAAPNGHCTRSSYSQTSTGVNWRYHCVSGSATVDSKGSITFDTPLHYTGQVKIGGVVMGYPIENDIAVEGVHRAACTSPED